MVPVVLSKKECQRLFKSGGILKHRVMLNLIYSAGLRSQEVCNLTWPDIDFDRRMIHIRKTRYQKDRYVPLSDLMMGGLKKLLAISIDQREAVEELLQAHDLWTTISV